MVYITLVGMRLSGLHVPWVEFLRVAIENEVMEDDGGDNECMGSSLIAAAAKTLTERAEGREAALEYTKCLLHLDTHGSSLHVEVGRSAAKDAPLGWFGEHGDA